MAKKRAPDRKINYPYLLMLVGLVLVVGGFLWSFQIRTGRGETQADIPFPEIDRVSLEDSLAALNQGEAVFLDVRNTRQYEAGHIPGAVLIPEPDLAQRFGELDRSDWIITYCT